MTIYLTEAAPEQAALVHRVMKAAFAEYEGKLNPPPECLTETVEDVARAIRKGGALIAWLDDVAVGSARYGLRGGNFHVERVSVLPDYRGYGIASRLMDYLETLASLYGYHEMELETRLSLPRNVALYEKLGYHITDMRQANPDADIQVTMVKNLHMLERVR